jgi:hypothetical protein
MLDLFFLALLLASFATTYLLILGLTRVETRK